MLYASLFGLWLFKSKWLKSQNFKTSALLFAYSIKILGGLAQQALYTFHYTDRSTSDIYRFFDDGLILKNSFYESVLDYLSMLLNINAQNPYYIENYYEKMNSWIKPFDSGFYNDNHIMIRLNSILNWIGFDFYETNSVIYTSAAFLGTLFLVTFLIPNRDKRNFSIVLLSIIPSCALWLVGGLKETLLIFGLGLFLHGFGQVIMNNLKTSTGWISLSLGLIVLLLVKIYVLLALIPSLLTALLVKKKKLNLISGIGIWLVIMFSGYAVLSAMGFEIIEYVTSKQHQFINHMNETTAGSAIQIPLMEKSLIGLIKYSPTAFISALILPISPSSLAESLLLLENIIFWLMIIMAFPRIIKSESIVKWQFILIVTFSFTTLLLIGTTTPVLGAIMRYRAPVLLLLVLFLSNYISVPFRKIQDQP